MDADSLDVHAWSLLAEGNAELFLQQRIPEVALFRGEQVEGSYFTNQLGLLKRRSSAQATKGCILKRFLASAACRSDDMERHECESPAAILRSAASEYKVISVAQLTELLEEPATADMVGCATATATAIARRHEFGTSDGAWSLQALVMPMHDFRMIATYNRDSSGETSLALECGSFSQAYPAGMAPIGRPEAQEPDQSDLLAQHEATVRSKLASIMQYLQQFRTCYIDSFEAEFIIGASDRAVLHGFSKVSLSDAPLDIDTDLVDSIFFSSETPSSYADCHWYWEGKDTILTNIRDGSADDTDGGQTPRQMPNELLVSDLGDRISSPTSSLASGSDSQSAEAVASGHRATRHNRGFQEHDRNVFEDILAEDNLVFSDDEIGEGCNIFKDAFAGVDKVASSAKPLARTDRRKIATAPAEAIVLGESAILWLKRLGRPAETKVVVQRVISAVAAAQDEAASSLLVECAAEKAAEKAGSQSPQMTSTDDELHFPLAGEHFGQEQFGRFVTGSTVASERDFDTVGKALQSPAAWTAVSSAGPSCQMHIKESPPIVAQPPPSQPVSSTARMRRGLPTRLQPLAGTTAQATSPPGSACAGDVVFQPPPRCLSEEPHPSSRDASARPPPPIGIRIRARTSRSRYCSSEDAEDIGTPLAYWAPWASEGAADTGKPVADYSSEGGYPASPADTGKLIQGIEVPSTPCASSRHFRRKWSSAD